MNKNLIKIIKWTNQWEMSFNPDLTKKAQEVIFHGSLRKQTIPQSILILQTCRWYIPFYTVYNPLLSGEIMNKNLIKIIKWTNQWEMSFNPDLTKKAQEVIFHGSLRKQTIPQSILILLQKHTLIARNILVCSLIKNLIKVFFNIWKKKHQMLIRVLEWYEN